MLSIHLTLAAVSLLALGVMSCEKQPNHNVMLEKYIKDSKLTPVSGIVINCKKVRKKSRIRCLVVTEERGPIEVECHPAGPTLFVQECWEDR